MALPQAGQQKAGLSGSISTTSPARSRPLPGPSPTLQRCHALAMRAAAAFPAWTSGARYYTFFLMILCGFGDSFPGSPGRDSPSLPGPAARLPRTGPPL